MGHRLSKVLNYLGDGWYLSHILFDLIFIKIEVVALSFLDFSPMFAHFEPFMKTQSYSCIQCP